ncbi:MAG: hypothetical protein Q8930_00965 [Bacillota bacterium]|nr:hypothetical protein [Bacillota bacterium]
MKKIKIIIIWSLIATVFQMFILLFLNNYYWKSQSSFSIVQVTQNDTSKLERPDINLPINARDIRVSYNSKHISFMENGKLTILNTSTGTANSISIPDKGTISYYRWLPDRDRMIIAEKYTKGYQSYIKLSNYDENLGGRNEIVDNHQQIVKIVLPDKNYEVTDMSLSTATSILYIRISKPGSKSIIYHMNTMNQIIKLGEEGYQMRDMEALSTEDKLIYEDSKYKKLVVVQSSKKLALPYVNEPVLLGVDDDDNIYVGSMSNGKVTKIYYGKLDMPGETWNTLEPKEPCARNEVFIGRKGKVFINDNLRGDVINLSDNIITEYKGEFISLYDKGIISMNNGKVLNQSFDKTSVAEN